jgi:hypothetical protein
MPRLRTVLAILFGFGMRREGIAANIAKLPDLLLGS